MPESSATSYPPALISHADEAVPATSSRVRQAYISHSTVGYMTYGVGAATAFIAVALGLSDAQAGLHSSALATGLIAAGVSGERLDRLFGERRVHTGAMVAMALGILMLATTPALALTLAGAAAIGFGNGLLLMFASRTTTSGGGALGRSRLARSTLIAMSTALAASLVVGVGVSVGIGWQVLIGPALIFVGIGLLIARTRGAKHPGSQAPTRRLPGRYWPAWSLVALVVAVEFAVVFWSVALVRTRTNVALEEAAFVLSAFVLGIVLGRATLSLRVIARREPIGLMRAGLILVAVSAITVLLSPSLGISAVVLVAGGTGLGILFPLSAASAIASAPGQAHVASARVVLAIGFGMFAGPLVLGVAADRLGLLSAWVLVPLTCAVALGLSFPVKRLLGAAD